MKLKAWINLHGGPTHIAAKLGVEAMTVHHWLAGKTSPKLLTLQKLIKLSKGSLTYESVINDTKKKGEA